MPMTIRTARTAQDSREGPARGNKVIADRSCVLIQGAYRIRVSRPIEQRHRQATGNRMEPTAGSPSQAVELRLGPIGQFALKTAIVAAAVVLSAWIMLDVLDGFAT